MSQLWGCAMTQQSKTPEELAQEYSHGLKVAKDAYIAGYHAGQTSPEVQGLVEALNVAWANLENMSNYPPIKATRSGIYLALAAFAKATSRGDEKE